MIRPRAALLCAAAALAGASPPATAAPRECGAVVTFCATATAGWAGAYSCPFTSGGEPQDLCDEHSGQGYVFLLTCSGTGDGPGLVDVYGCGTSFHGGVGFGAVSGGRWVWNDVPSICHTVGIEAVFTLAASVTADHEFCVTLG